MPDRRSLVSTLWLATSLALLAPVAPAWTTEFAAVRSDCLRRNFALLPGQPTNRISTAPAADADPQVNALASENEEQDRTDALEEPRVSFLIPCPFRKIADRQLIAPRSVPSLYPLRC